jgi:hypothetical protein
VGFARLEESSIGKPALYLLEFWCKQF